MFPFQVSSVVPNSYQSVVKPFTREASHGVQVYEEVSSEQSKIDMVGRPMQHVSAVKQATGEAVYCDDTPRYESMY